MSAAGSVTTWIDQLKDGQEEALAKLHARYWPALVDMARARLRGVAGRIAGEEDVAQEAFWTFYRSFKTGRLPRLRSRHDLLALLTHIVACKAANQIERELGVQRRGQGRVYQLSTLDPLADATCEGPNVQAACSLEKNPLEQAILTDSYLHYMGGLSDTLREVAELYLAGLTHKEIAARIGCVERTIGRKLAMVFKKWQRMARAGVDEV